MGWVATPFNGLPGGSRKSPLGKPSLGLSGSLLVLLQRRNWEYSQGLSVDMDMGRFTLPFSTSVEKLIFVSDP